MTVDYGVYLDALDEVKMLFHTAVIEYEQAVAILRGLDIPERDIDNELGI